MEPRRAETPHDIALLSLKEVAAALRISRASMFRLIARGDLPVVKLGRRTLVEAEDLRQLVNESRNRVVAPP